jgi:hypothetical protein
MNNGCTDYSLGSYIEILWVLVEYQDFNRNEKELEPNKEPNQKLFLATAVNETLKLPRGSG